MNLDYEKIIDEIISCFKDKGDLSVYKKNRKTSSFVTLISRLNDIPKTKIPDLDLLRVRNQILDRISVPELKTVEQGWFTASTLQLLRIGAGALASLLIVVSLTLGTAVAALNSVPGDAIYPLKKIVENVELKLTPEDKRPNLQLKFADNRVDELQQILQAQASGQISAVDVQKIVSVTVKDLQKNTKAAATQPTPAVTDRISDISNQLRITSIQTEGQIKIDLEQAASDIEESLPEQTPAPDSSILATGKLTSVSKNTASIGTAKFSLTAQTEYINVTKDDLKVDQLVSIEGAVDENDRTYAKTITLISEVKPEVEEAQNSQDDTQTDTTDTDTTQETPAAQ